MANVISIIIGIVAGILMIPGLVPLFGWLNWIVLVIAGVGLLFGLISQSNHGRNINLIVRAWRLCG